MRLSQQELYGLIFLLENLEGYNAVQLEEEDYFPYDHNLNLLKERELVDYFLNKFNDLADSREVSSLLIGESDD